jgi:phosphoglycolate phosphatase-like HAD superfamily hydrolase
MTHSDAAPPGSPPGSETESSGFPNDRRKRNIPIATDRRRAQNAAEKRKNSERRRLIDPTTCERDYSEDETEFMKTMDRYKRENARPFPTWTEVLEVLHSLGYSRVAEPTALPGGKREAATNPNPPVAAPPVQNAAPAADSGTIPNSAANRRKRNIPVATDHRAHPKPSQQVSEFKEAMDQYKRENRRPFPTWSEVLEVLRSLGYRRGVEAAIPIGLPAPNELVTTPAPMLTPPPVAQPTAN